MGFIIQPFEGNSLGEYLNELLRAKHGQFHEFQAAVAFAKKSGVRRISEGISEFLNTGANARIIVGIDHQGTSIDGLELLLENLDSKGELWVNHCSEPFVTFHPKIYLFSNANNALVIIGSQNITEGGLYTNDEVSSVTRLDLKSDVDLRAFEDLKNVFDSWCDKETGNAIRIDSTIIRELIDTGKIIGEQEAQKELRKKLVQNEKTSQNEKGKVIFSKSNIARKAPRISMPKGQVAAKKMTADPKPSERIAIGFVMTMQKTDVGTGQTSVGTSRRSPEIFIPLAARKFSPSFWGWVAHFTEDPTKPGKFDRKGVKIRLGGEIVTVNMMTWPDKSDFRLRSEALRSAGNIGDILRLEKPVDQSKYDYYAEIIPSGTTGFEEYLQLCNQVTRNSKRIWGYYF